MISASLDIKPTGRLSVDARGDPKHANNKFRWNLLWLVFTIGVVPIGLWLGFVSPLAQAVFAIATGGFGLFVLGICCVNVIRAIQAMKSECRKDKRIKPGATDEKIKEVGPNLEAGTCITMEDVLHVALLAAYKEPLSMIKHTLDSMAAQTQAKQILVVVAFEAATPQVKRKINELKSVFENSFYEIVFTIHPAGWSGVREISGKCSNSNYGTRAVVEYMEAKGIYNEDKTTFTSLDTDTVFPPRYFEKLAYDFVTRDDKFEVFWQGMLVYNFHLGERPFFCRCLALFRSAFMVGLLIPFSINPMSVFSLSMKLLRQANFIHPGYQMDDLTFFVSATSAVARRVQIVPINMPIICGPTSGKTYLEEITEWITQGKRWTIGAAEVLHYICIKGKTLPWGEYIRFLFVFMIYYGFVLCSMTLTAILSLVGQSYQPSVGPNAW
eukprot:CAMPEP_0203760578 /NCGR_PEP_ID=MMETSP0098-20131031/13840_1 /ASSEMBLY_ACC=CAM_ASM_000208 /TAXON_ID=96639 /ORGANISM=" , Strain NY0313808BC1" /LENGTH=439 /DNA_ID=CAMNT_0050654203 /DNA_START=1587 /DNA_END=2903 /DNA_ORIENTATION=-